MTDLKALLFDVDGTLADTERDGHRTAFNRAFEEAGLDWHWSPGLYGRLLRITGGKERIRHFMETESPRAPFGSDDADTIARLHRRKTHFYTELLREGRIPLRSGVERLLREARAEGLRLAVATTTTPANVEALVVNTLGSEALGWFEVIAAGDVVPNKKPAPDIYLWAMRQMDLAADQCLALEDSHNGLLSVRDAGLRSLVITVNGYTETEDFDGASLVVDQLGEPGSPIRRLDGNVPVTTELVDVGLLRLLHAKAWENQ
ncbi:MAG: HAD family hydrolase [Pseudomonadota bacterium]